MKLIHEGIDFHLLKNLRHSFHLVLAACRLIHLFLLLLMLLVDLSFIEVSASGSSIRPSTKNIA